MCDQDTVRIPLRAKDGSVRAYALVDAADAEWVNQWQWRLHRASGYAIRWIRLPNGTPHEIRLHREILGLPRISQDLVGDHINRDRLNNRRSNLRVVTKRENMQNRPSVPGSTSRYRGVSWDREKHKWRAQISSGGKKFNLGLFTSETYAALIARQARMRLMKGATD